MVMSADSMSLHTYVIPELWRVGRLHSSNPVFDQGNIHVMMILHKLGMLVLLHHFHWHVTCKGCSIVAYLYNAGSCKYGLDTSRII